MKLNKFFMLGLAGLAFAACSNEELAENGELGNGDGQTVKVTLSRGKATTRAIDGTAVGGYNTVRSLSVCFYSAGDQIVFKKEVTPDTDADFFENINNGETSHKSVLTIGGVPGNAKRIYIIANEPDTKINTNTWETVKASEVHLAEMLATEEGDTFNEQSAVLTGYQANIGAGNLVDEVMTVNVNVELKPVASRFEIDGFVCKNVPAGSNYEGLPVKEFEICGVYMNNFYDKGYLDPTQDDPDRTQISYKDAADFTAAKYGEWSFMLDEGVISGNVYSAIEGYTSVAELEDDEIYALKRTDNKVLGYPLLQGDVPHIIIRLNVTYDNNNIDEQAVKYLTIEKFKADGGNWNGEIERGNVYKITDLAFDPSNLSDIPYEGTKSVVATVSVAAWTGVPLQPDWN